VLFAGVSNVLNETSVLANSDNIEKAIGFIDREQGSGGTELLPALQLALALKGVDGYSRSFIIATDGYVDVEKGAFDLIRNNLGKANFFSFGIGTSVNRFIIEGMAHVGMGMPFVITKPEEAEATAEKFRKYIQNPVLTHIRVAYDNFDAYDIEPLSVPDVFSERPVIIFGKYRGTPQGSINIKGQNGEGEYKNNLQVSTAKISESNIALRYLWARERIRILGDFTATGYNGGEEYKPAITELGLKYNLLTSYTSFIAIDNDIRNKNGNSTTVDQPLPMPEGVSDNAVSSGSVMGKALPMVVSESTKSEEDLDLLETPVTEEKTLVVASEPMPVFDDANITIEAFIAKQMKYPTLARENGIAGSVYVSFTVDEKGAVTHIKVLRGIGGGCDEEAIRLVKLTSGKWKPAIQNGKPVKVVNTIVVKFTLPHK
jgi:Ca-activated chloride channel family protein